MINGKLIVISIMLLVISAFLVYFSFQLMRLDRTKFKKSAISRESLAKNKYIRIILDGFEPTKGTPKHAKLVSKISKVNTKYTLDDFYILKVIFSLILAILILLVVLTNHQFNKNMVLSEVQMSSSDSTRYSTYIGKYTAEEIANYYRIVDKNTDMSSLLYMDSEDAKVIINGVLKSTTQLGESQRAYVSAQVYSDLQNIGTLFSAKYLCVMIVSLLCGYFIPDLLVLVLVIIRSREYTLEVYSLETLIIILGSMENMPVKNIIEELVDNSKLLKARLSEFYSIYLMDREQAYSSIYSVDDSVGFTSSFTKIINILRVLETSDRKASVESIIHRRRVNHEAQQIDRQTRLERCDLICLVVYFLVFFQLVGIFILPWSSILGSML